jgi:membrane protein
MARSMNRVYGVRGCGFKCERRRSFFVILLFAAFFLMASLAATVPTLFVGRHLGFYFETWRLAAAPAQVVSYGIAILAALALFIVIYRIVPNAGQKLADVWPGALTAATLFVLMAQAFPLYLRFFHNDNRFGQVFGLISLLITWFYALAHVLLFGTYVNATYFKHRHKRPHLIPNATKA